MKKRTALITGASSGIGYELSKCFAAEGYNLILVARREERLQALKEYINAEFNVQAEYIVKDLSKPESANELYIETIELLKKSHIEKIDVLINNAGVGDLTEFRDSNLEKIETMINLNILSLTKLSRLFINDICSSEDGALINIASTAAFQAIPCMAVYAATKSFVLSFTEAISEEIKSQQLKTKIICICPGITESEFQVRADMESLKIDRKLVASSADVAKYTVKSLKKGKKTTAVHGFMNKIGTLLPRILPRSSVSKLSHQIMKKIV